MAKTDSRVDAYLEKVPPFARPVLSHLRQLVHDTCPDVEETWKWSFPNFLYKGSILCNMAAFKQHCAFGFWLASQMQDPAGIMKEGASRNGMGHLGKITGLQDLPEDALLISYIQEAMHLIDNGVKQKKPANAASKAPIPVPDDLVKALQENAKAHQTFEAFSNSCRREYLEWITEAKTEATRNKRIAQTIAWLEEGKKRNWKYENC